MGWTGAKPSDFAKVIAEDGNKKLRKIVAIGLQSVVMRSPVMDGAYRGNHRITINSEDHSYNMSEVDKDGPSTISKGNYEIAKAKLGDLVYIQNNLPYSIAIENGHSKEQAPNGVYSIAFLNMRNAK